MIQSLDLCLCNVIWRSESSTMIGEAPLIVIAQSGLTYWAIELIAQPGLSSLHVVWYLARLSGEDFSSHDFCTRT